MQNILHQKPQDSITMKELDTKTRTNYLSHFNAFKSRLTVTDFIREIVQIVRRDLDQLRISTQEVELMEPVKLSNKE